MNERLAGGQIAPAVPGFTLLDPPPPGASVAAIRAVREADGLPVWLHLVLIDVDAPTARRLRPEPVPPEAGTLAVIGQGESADRCPYMVTPRPGTSLGERLADGALEVDAVRGAVDRVGRSLAVLHGHGLLHRGVTPNAIHQAAGSYLLTPPLPAVFAELALLGETGDEHVPPEVLTGGDWTRAGDLYALASTVWMLLAGRPPFGARDRLARLVRAQPPPLRRADVPGSLADALRAALARTAEARPDLATFVRAVTDDRLETLPPSRPLPESGRPLGSRYLLDEPIGQGATGQVWRGRVRDTGAAVAVKLLRSELAEEPDVVTRFMRERTTLTRLSHPHLVRVQDLVAEGEALAIVMDLVDGEDLRRFAQRGPLQPNVAAELLSQTASALAAVHAAGVVHRDFKPANVLVTVRDGHLFALLTDFGVARAAESPTLTRLTEFVGTPAYLAPEVVTGRGAGPAADVYAMGVTSYELLAGHRPFSGAATPALLRAHVEQLPPRPDGLTDSQWTLIAACLSKSPDARPSAAQLAESWRLLAADPTAPLPGYAAPDADSALKADDAATEGGVLETMAGRRPLPDAPVDGPPPRKRRWPWYAAAAIIVIGGGFAAGVLLGRGGHHPPAAPTRTPGHDSRGYPLAATVTQQGAVPVVKWTLDPKLVGPSTFVLVYQDGVPISDSVIKPPVNSKIVTGASPGTRACFTVRAYDLSADPSPSTPQPACITPKGTR